MDSRGRREYSSTTIGREMEDAIAQVNQWQQQAATVLTSYEHDINQTIAMLFLDDDIAKSEATKNIVVSPHGQIALNLQEVPDAVLTLNFEKSRFHALRPEYSEVHPSRSVPLLAYMKQVQAIYYQYEQVKAVLRWFNENATRNAIRYYFPAAATLCPQTFADVAPAARHRPPAGVHDWLQPIRDTAATVASAVMLPSDAMTRRRKDMWLTFAPTLVHGAGDAKYTTDQITFNV